MPGAPLVHRVPGDSELGPVLLEVLPARKGDKEVAGERVLAAAAYVSNAEHDAGEDRFKELAARISETALSACPFVEPFVIGRSTPYLEAKNVRQRLTFHPLLEVADEKFLGFGGLPHRTSCKNLFLANREVVPGLGLEGEFMAGVRAATLVQEALKKHDPLK